MDRSGVNEREREEEQLYLKLIDVQYKKKLKSMIGR